jgi:NAD(P)-dependent dehydrogenase (short-subunit alcohol dehydrogenase family)
MARVEGKVAIITGAAGGIGLADAQLLASEGAKVVLLDLDQAILEQRVAEIRAVGGTAISFTCDVASEADWQRVVAATVAEFGRIDVLVNNAAMAYGKGLEELSLDEWNHVMAVNLTGPFLGMKHVVPEMRKVGKGSIINISSLAALAGGKNADGGDAAYSASKGGVRSVTKHAAQMLAADNIRVNSLHPGSIRTERSEAHRKAVGAENWSAAALAEKIPLPPHQGLPEDIAYGVLYLASDESKFVTGIELVIDGGFISR